MKTIEGMPGAAEHAMQARLPDIDWAQLAALLLGLAALVAGTQARAPAIRGGFQ